MYKTSTFLASIFHKFQVRDKWVREQVMFLYSDIIDAILRDVPIQKRVIVFRALLLSVESTIIYLDLLKDVRNVVGADKLISASVNVIKCAIDVNTYLVNKIGLRSDTACVFDSVIDQLRVDDIVCDIGECLLTLKNPGCKESEKEGVHSRLCVLLSDYNSITGNTLKVSDILSLQESKEVSTF